MAQIGNEIVDRPPPGKPVDEQAAADIEALEEVNGFLLNEEEDSCSRSD